MNIKEKWQKELGTPACTIPNEPMTLQKEYDYPDYKVEIYIQKTGPDTIQRVSMAIPKKANLPCPSVVVPFYHSVDMLGFNPETNEVHPRYSKYPIMDNLAKRGYITISADAYPFHLLYDGNVEELKGFEMWGYAAKKLKSEHPQWTGIGKLTSDTTLLVNALCEDERVDSSKIGIMGHSLGGKMAFYTGCTDERIKVIVASDFGIGWDQTNWKDIWYWGDYVDTLKDKKMDHAELLSAYAPKPFCLIAGEFDNEESWEIMCRAEGYNENKDGLKIINHATGHMPPPDALEEAYKFIDSYLK